MLFVGLIASCHPCFKIFIGSIFCGESFFGFRWTEVFFFPTLIGKNGDFERIGSCFENFSSMFSVLRGKAYLYLLY